MVHHLRIHNGGDDTYLFSCPQCTNQQSLVDDETIQLQLLSDLVAAELRSMDSCASHRIDTFRNGQTFLDHWKPGDYDVVILDIFMGGITGVNVARKIREEDEDVKLVFCSRSNEFAAESYQVNAQYYLVKPAVPGSIANMLQRLNLDMNYSVDGLFYNRTLFK